MLSQQCQHGASTALSLAHRHSLWLGRQPQRALAGMLPEGCQVVLQGGLHLEVQVLAALHPDWPFSECAHTGFYMPDTSSVSLPQDLP